VESILKIIPEIEVKDSLKSDIQKLRNLCFPEFALDRSYYKQLPHYRVISYKGSELSAYLGLDYRIISIDGVAIKILGIIDFCVLPALRGQGIGSKVLSFVTDFAETKDVDFLVLIADNPAIYLKHGFKNIATYSSWLRIDQHKNFGVAVEFIDDLYVKALANKEWPSGHVDWLGYMF
jgi:GNAT superfamily N-acetyltransferase